MIRVARDTGAKGAGGYPMPDVLTRALARPCPVCGAPAQARCIDPRSRIYPKPMKKPHSARKPVKA